MRRRRQNDFAKETFARGYFSGNFPVTGWRVGKLVHERPGRGLVSPPGRNGIHNTISTNKQTSRKVYFSEGAGAWAVRGAGHWGGLGLWCKYWWKEVCEHVYKDIVYPYEIVKQEAYRPVQLRCNLARIRKTHAKLQTKLRNFGCTSTSIYMLMCRALFAKYLLGTLAHLQNIFTSQGRVMPNYKVKKCWQYF